MRTGEQYLESIRDGRRVMCGGEFIDDLTTHPKTRGYAHAVAAFYDLHNDPEHAEYLTYVDDDGVRRYVGHGPADARVDPRAERAFRHVGDQLPLVDGIAWAAGGHARNTQVLLQADRHRPNPPCMVHPRRGTVELGQVKFADKRLEWNVPPILHRVDAYVLRRAEPARYLGRLPIRNGAVARLLREQVLGTRILRAEAAFAAEVGPLVPLIRAGNGETRTAHHVVRTNVVAGEVSWTHLRAVGALVVRGLTDAVPRTLWELAPPHKSMPAREDDQPPVVLVTG